MKNKFKELGRFVGDISLNISKAAVIHAERKNQENIDKKNREYKNFLFRSSEIRVLSVMNLINNTLIESPLVCEMQNGALVFQSTNLSNSQSICWLYKFSNFSDVELRQKRQFESDVRRIIKNELNYDKFYPKIIIRKIIVNDTEIRIYIEDNTHLHTNRS